MRAVARAATVVVAGFAAGLAAGEAVERIGVDRVEARAPARATAPFAGTLPPTDAKVLSSGALADIELTDRHGRGFTLDRMVGDVVVIGFAPAPCDAGCARRIEALRRVHRRLGERSPGEDRDAGAAVEFVLVSSASAAAPGVASPSDVAAMPDGTGPEAGERRWRVGRAGPGALAELRARLGLGAATPGASGGGRPSVHVLDTRGRLVQRYRADPLDGVRLGDDVAYLRDRGS